MTAWGHCRRSALVASMLDAPPENCRLDALRHNVGQGHAARIVRGGEVVTGCRDDGNALSQQIGNVGLLDHQITRKAAGVLDQSGANAIAADARQGDHQTP